MALFTHVRALTREFAPAITEHKWAERGHVPVFVDGTAIEVDEELFEGAGIGYDCFDIDQGSAAQGGFRRPRGIDLTADGRAYRTKGAGRHLPGGNCEEQPCAHP